MSLQFILGRSGTGKTSKIVEEIRSKLIEDPLGDPIIYIVPDQMSFQAESELLSGETLNGTIRSQVYSFNRLAWLILGETGGLSRQHMNIDGMHMLIQKILQENGSRLKVFKNSTDKLGFHTQLAKLFTEYRRYCVTPEQLAQQAMLEESPLLKDKLLDFSLLYEQFNQSLANKYVLSEDYFALLAERITHSSYLRKATIYVDGFHGFTQLEKNILAQLFLYTKKVTIALTLDRPYKLNKPSEDSLFRMTGETYFLLSQLADQLSVNMEEDIILEESLRFLQNESGKFLESYFYQYSSEKYHTAPSMTVMSAKNRRVEIEQIARQIIQCARDGYRYRDMIVLTRDGEQYAKLVETIFRDYDIPVFIDQKSQMLFHPFIECIRASLDAVESDFAFDSIFRAFKTDLFFSRQEKLDHERAWLCKIENYALSRGIRGSKWKDKWIYRNNSGLDSMQFAQTDYELSVQEKLNDYKSAWFKPLNQLSRNLRNAEVISEYIQALQVFFEELKAREKLEGWIKKEESNGELVLAKHHKQAWENVQTLFEQLMDINGDSPCDFLTFKQMIQMGLESLTFSLVPPSLDQVILGNMDVSKPQNIKIVFAIGLNEGVLPKRMSNAGILTEEERVRLQQSGLQMAPDALTTLFDEEFVAYSVFTLASDWLYLSYPIADDEGKSMLPSGYIKKIETLFPEMKKMAASDMVEKAQDAETQLGFITHTKATLRYLSSQLQSFKQGEKVHSIWWDVYNESIVQDAMREALEFILSGLLYQNRSDKLKKETIDQLYGETIKGSVSRIEVFNSCPFSYFTRYGLGLKERETFSFDAPAIGTFFHETIKKIADRLEENNLSWSELNQAKCEALAEEAIDQVAPLLQNEILYSSERMKFLKRKFGQIIQQTAYTMNRQTSKSDFIPYKFEVGFGTADASIPSLSIPLKNGKRMELVGRIDRIDSVVNPKDGKRYVAVVDYKSGAKNINYSEVYYGIALQMFTYLSVLLTHSNSLFQEQVHPAGMLYFHLQNPLLKGKDTLSDSREVLEERRLRQFKLDGLVTDDEEVLTLFDRDFGLTSKSDMIPVSKNKNGSFSATSKVASDQQIQMLVDHVKGVYKKSGNDILAGKTTISPYKLGNKTPCTFCDYKTVCQFDPTLKKNEYRNLKSMKFQDALQQMKYKEDSHD